MCPPGWDKVKWSAKNWEARATGLPNIYVLHTNFDNKIFLIKADGQKTRREGQLKAGGMKNLYLI